MPSALGSGAALQIEERGGDVEGGDELGVMDKILCDRSDIVALMGRRRLL